MSITVNFEQGTANPRIVRIVTTDTLAQVRAAGWYKNVSPNQLMPSDKVEVYYGSGTSSAANAFFDVTIAAGVVTLSLAESNIILPVVSGDFAVFSGTSGALADLGYLPSDAAKTRVVMAGSAVQVGYIAHFVDVTGTIDDTAGAVINAGNIQAGLSGTAGTLISYPSTASKGSLILAAVANTGNTNTTISNAAMGQASVVSIPDPGAATANFIISALAGAGVQHITTGSLQVDAGGLLAGLAAGGTAGSLTLYPATTGNGSLILSPLNAGGAFNTTIRNSVMGQSSVISIPDPGAATANFLLDTGAANIIAQQQFVGISNVLTFGTGTWTVTRIAQGNYVSRHTAADETSIIAIDITPIIRAAASKGFRLDSFDYIYSIGTLAMDAHTVTLDRIVYANNVAVSVNSVALTGSLATATQANPYVSNIAVTTPAFDVTDDSKYVMEITANNAATTAYDFYGVMLRFSQTIG